MRGSIAISNGVLGEMEPHVTIRRSRLFGTYPGGYAQGVHIWLITRCPATGRAGVTTVVIEDSEIFNNADGIYVNIQHDVACCQYDPVIARVSISRSSIFENEWEGIYVDVGEGAAKEAVFELRDVVIDGNGTDPHCWEPPHPRGWPCNGISLSGKGGALVTIADTKIRRNTDWGIAAKLKKCGYYRDNFVGQVVFEGHNVIEGNNTAGNHKGNPGNHPWNRPEVPDGQVCLP